MKSVLTELDRQRKEEARTHLSLFQTLLSFLMLHFTFPNLFSYSYLNFNQSSSLLEGEKVTEFWVLLLRHSHRISFTVVVFKGAEVLSYLHRMSKFAFRKFTIFSFQRFFPYDAF